jgi:hypothetical protein
MKYKRGTLLSLSLNRIIFDMGGKAHSCKSGDLFLVLDKNVVNPTIIDIVSVQGFYFAFEQNDLQRTFTEIDV